jgi:hypothetical protein
VESKRRSERAPVHCKGPHPTNGHSVPAPLWGAEQPPNDKDVQPNKPCNPAPSWGAAADAKLAGMEAGISFHHCIAGLAKQSKAKKERSHA